MTISQLDIDRIGDKIKLEIQPIQASLVALHGRLDALEARQKQLEQEAFEASQGAKEAKDGVRWIWKTGAAIGAILIGWQGVSAFVSDWKTKGVTNEQKTYQTDGR